GSILQIQPCRPWKTPSRTERLGSSIRRERPRVGEMIDRLEEGAAVRIRELFDCVEPRAQVWGPRARFAEPRPQTLSERGTGAYMDIREDAERGRKPRIGAIEKRPRWNQKVHPRISNLPPRLGSGRRQRTRSR